MACVHTLLSYPALRTLLTLSLHDALPISGARAAHRQPNGDRRAVQRQDDGGGRGARLSRPLPLQWGRRLQEGGQLERRSEEHTSERQSPCDLVCSLMLEKKNMTRTEKDNI